MTVEVLPAETNEVTSIDLNLPGPPYDPIASFDWVTPIAIAVIGIIVISAAFTIILDIKWRKK